MKAYIGQYKHRWTASRWDNYWMKRKFGETHRWNMTDEDYDVYNKSIPGRLGNIAQSVLNHTINRIVDRLDRKIKVRIDNYDIWNMDDTLSLIIAPMLRKYQETGRGMFDVDDEDVPENLRRSAAPPTEYEYDLDDNYEARFKYVLGEMVFSFTTLEKQALGEECWEDQFHSGEIDYSFQPSDDEFEGQKLYKMVEGPNHTHKFDAEGQRAFVERMKNGHRLFGKYYMGLWT